MAIKIIHGSSLKEAEEKTRREFEDREYRILSRSRRPHDSLIGRLVGKEVIQLVVSDDIPLLKNAKENTRKHRNDIFNKAYSKANLSENPAEDFSLQKTRVLEMMKGLKNSPGTNSDTDDDTTATLDSLFGHTPPAPATKKSTPVNPAVRPAAKIRNNSRAKPAHQKENHTVRNEKETEELGETVSKMMDLLKILLNDTSPSRVKADSRKVFVYYKKLNAQGVESDLASRLAIKVADALSAEERKNNNKVVDEYVEQIARYIELAKSPIVNNRPKVITLIGPTGAGKTTTLPKIAMEHLKRNKKIGFLSLDTYRIGALDQLKTCAEIMDIPFRYADNATQANEAVKAYYACDVILVDTAGRSPNDTEILGETRRMLREISPDETHLVLSANSSGKFLCSVMREFGSIPYDSVVFTKMDEIDTYGHILNTLVQFKKPLAYYCTGQNIPQDIEPADKTRLAKLLLEKDMIETNK